MKNVKIDDDQELPSYLLPSRPEKRPEKYKAQANYCGRMRGRGYHKICLWVPHLYRFQLSDVAAMLRDYSQKAITPEDLITEFNRLLDGILDG